MGWGRLGQRSLVIYGPPGTGKTTRILDLCVSEIDRGTPPDRIALVTFSKSAQLEAASRAASRLQLAPDEAPWIRTLHSTAYHLLGLSRGQVYQPQHHAKFCSQYAYAMTAAQRGAVDDFSRAPRRTRDDEIRAVHEWGLQRDVTLRQAWQEAPRHNVGWKILERYTRVFEAWKRDRNLFDFFDMLLHARGLPGPDVDVCFVDEAQDLTPLQISLVYSWFSQCERVYIAGDDDQAIHGWNGADPEWLIGLRERCDYQETLAQSHRVPEAVRQVANRIIGQNQRRVPKRYASARQGGQVRGRTIEQAVGEVRETVARTGGWTSLVLVRNRIYARHVADLLLRHGVPFGSEIPPAAPLDNKGIRQAIIAAQALVAGEEIRPPALRALLDQLALPGYLPPGTSQRAKLAARPVSAQGLTDEWGLGAALDRLRAYGPVRGLLCPSEATRLHLDQVLRDHGSLPWPAPVTLTTIHAAKGREADTVVVVSDITRATHDEWSTDPEGENRVAYVACTRARHELIVCDPRTPRSYPYVRHVDAVAESMRKMAQP